MDAQTIFDLYNKINSLERKIIILQSQLEENKKQCIERIPESQKIPDSNLFSNNLITRSFTVYGHLLLASLIIGLISFIFTIILTTLFSGAFAGTFFRIFSQ